MNKNTADLRNKKLNIRFSLVFIIFAMTTLFISCANMNFSNKAENADNRKRIVCTIFPCYDWTMNILGDMSDKYEVIYLLENGQDLHSYQPSAKDIAVLTDADIIVTVGGPSDQWITEVIKNGSNEKQQVIYMMESLKEVIKEEEIIEGMQSREEGHDHEEDATYEHEDNHEEEEIEYDEHVWLSAENAKIICNDISDVLAKIDFENKDYYQKNCDNYLDKLNNFIETSKQKINETKGRTIIVADRFPFRYFTDEFGISYYAAFPGCSTESDSSFETVVFLIEKTTELDVNHIFVMENSNGELAKTITDYCDIGEVYELNSMQSVTKAEIDNGVSYIGMMENNIDNLIRALK